tara:strand:+ start:6293 stop:6868 length:576 start_codon:yes stop_codon:yes gene_type:complete
MLDSNDEHPCQQSDCSDNLCVICYDNLIQPNKPDKTPFTIPECGHTFHQLCINSWFRQGNEKCPLCNDMGAAASNNSMTRRPYWGVHEDRFSLLNKLSKKKTAPKILVKEINKFKKKQERMKAYKEEYKKWKETKITINNKELTVHELVKEGERKRKIARKQEWELRKFKRAVCEKVNIVPLILVEKKTIN